MEGVPAENESTSNLDQASARARPPEDEPTSEKTIGDEPAEAKLEGGLTPVSLAQTDAAVQLEGAAAESLNSAASPEDVPVEIQPHRVVEAILFSTDTPIPAAKVAVLMGVGDARDVRKHVEHLNEEYASLGMSFRIQEVAGGFQMLTLPAYNPWLKKLLRARQETRLSPAALETLAILAYKQPCTRADVEAIRGVAAGELIGRLRELNLVKIVGRAEDLGRPLLYGTTKRFLEVFGLPSLEELPQVEALAGGNSTGAVRESATMPAAALANGPITDQPAAGHALELPLPLTETSPATERSAAALAPMDAPAAATEDVAHDIEEPAPTAP